MQHDELLQVIGEHAWQQHGIVEQPRLHAQELRRAMLAAAGNAPVDLRLTEARAAHASRRPAPVGRRE